MNLWQRIFCYFTYFTIIRKRDLGPLFYKHNLSNRPIGKSFNQERWWLTEKSDKQKNAMYIKGINYDVQGHFTNLDQFIRKSFGSRYLMLLANYIFSCKLHHPVKSAPLRIEAVNSKLDTCQQHCGGDGIIMERFLCHYNVLMFKLFWIMLVLTIEQ